jgi:hypothetical protein
LMTLSSRKTYRLGRPSSWNLPSRIGCPAGAAQRAGLRVKVHADTRAGSSGGRNTRVMVCKGGVGGQPLAWSHAARRQAEAEGTAVAERRVEGRELNRGRWAYSPWRRPRMTGSARWARTTVCEDSGVCDDVVIRWFLSQLGAVIAGSANPTSLGLHGLLDFDLSMAEIARI